MDISFDTSGRICPYSFGYFSCSFPPLGPPRAREAPLQRAGFICLQVWCGHQVRSDPLKRESVTHSSPRQGTRPALSGHTVKYQGQRGERERGTGGLHCGSLRKARQALQAESWHFGVLSADSWAQGLSPAAWYLDLGGWGRGRMPRVREPDQGVVVEVWTLGWLVCL